ncbi:MAG: lipid II flippase Amj family protein [bacterium]|nr:lipid II flippase Amj family protein [bacterium]
MDIFNILINDKRLVIIFVITFFINFLSVSSASLRFAGIKTNSITTSLSLSNIILLITRLANLFQTPFLGSMIDLAFKYNQIDTLLLKLHIIIFSATLGTFVGILFFNTFENIFIKWINLFNKTLSIPKTFYYLIYPKTYLVIIKSISKVNFYLDKNVLKEVPKIIIFSSLFVSAFWTTGVLSAMYASVLVPEYARTATILSGIVNGIATILFTIFLDPIIAHITDKVYNNQKDIKFLYNSVFLMLIFTLLGTILAQFVLKPGAYLIAIITKLVATF